MAILLNLKSTHDRRATHKPSYVQIYPDGWTPGIPKAAKNQPPPPHMTLICDALSCGFIRRRTLLRQITKTKIMAGTTSNNRRNVVSEHVNQLFMCNLVVRTARFEIELGTFNGSLLIKHNKPTNQSYLVPTASLGTFVCLH